MADNSDPEMTPGDRVERTHELLKRLRESKPRRIKQLEARLAAGAHLEPIANFPPAVKNSWEADQDFVILYDRETSWEMCVAMRHHRGGWWIFSEPFAEYEEGVPIALIRERFEYFLVAPKHPRDNDVSFAFEDLFWEKQARKQGIKR